MTASPLRYLDQSRLDALDPMQFRQTRPFPWVNPEGLLTPDGREALIRGLPDVSMFEPQFGIPRSWGQKSHDRYVLNYRRELDVAPAWHEFLEELHGPEYRRFLRRMLGPRPVWLTFHWQYAPRGASVSPHCDAKRKIGSHIFYLNADSDWDESWGGQTLILDDGGRLDPHSAPDFDEFESATASDTSGNRSLLFARRGNSWHGVRELQCPEGKLRKIFIVVIDDALKSGARRLLAPLKGKRSLEY